jgi:aspartate racemase
MAAAFLRAAPARNGPSRHAPNLPLEQMPMKTIGLLGGTSWPSTLAYYRILNELAQERLGGFHSASLLLRSIDYHEIKRRYHDGWDEIPALLEKEIRALADLRPDCLLICNNTLHKAFDAIEARLALPMPAIHIVKATARAACARGLRRLLLLGTRFTMEDGFYQRRLEESGLRVTTPAADERSLIQGIQSQLARGVAAEDFRKTLASLIDRHAGTVDAAVLACTELPLAVSQGDCRVPVLDPTALQCREAFEFAVT